MRGIHCRLLCGLFAALGVSALSAGGVAPARSATNGLVALRYVVDPAGTPIMTRGQSMIHSDVPLAPLKLPRFTSSRPHFLQARLGDGPNNLFDFVLDESTPGLGYDLLYADTIHTRDLSVVTPIHAGDFSFGRGFGPIPIPIQAGGRSIICQVGVSIAGNISVYRLHALGHFEGTATLADSVYQVAVLDSNGNGLIDDTTTTPDGDGDRFCIDLDRDGKYTVGSRSGEYLTMGRHIRIAGRFYDLTVLHDTSGLLLAPTAARMVKLTSAEGDFRVSLGSAQGSFWLDSEKGSALLPAGEYTLHNWSIYRRDARGENWEASGQQSGSRRLSASGELASLPRLAEPISARVSIENRGPKGVEFNLSLRPVIGDMFVNVYREGNKEPPPGLRIVNEQGISVAALQFHYG